MITTHFILLVDIYTNITVYAGFKYSFKFVK